MIKSSTNSLCIAMIFFWITRVHKAANSWRVWPCKDENIQYYNIHIYIYIHNHTYTVYIYFFYIFLLLIMKLILWESDSELMIKISQKTWQNPPALGEPWSQQAFTTPRWVRKMLEDFRSPQFFPTKRKDGAYVDWSG
jgi:hypothetical protein